MTPRLARHLVFATLLITLPCFTFVIFCSGFLPLGAMTIVAGRLVASRDPGVLVLLIPLVIEGAVYAFLLHIAVRRLLRDSHRLGFVSAVIVAAGLASAALPVNHFDCMDGHPATRCSALRMYFGWLREPDAPGSLYVGARCGDFGW